MAETCTHLDAVRCGHIGCYDHSPNRHATAHWNLHADHPLIRSYEPGDKNGGPGTVHAPRAFEAFQEFAQR